MLDDLKATREQMKSRFSSAQIWFITYSILAGILLTLAFAMLVLVNLASPLHLADTGDGEWIAYWAMGIGTAIALFVALPWTYATWWRHYYFVWRHLQFTDLAQLVADGAQWNDVVEQGRHSVWQRTTGLRRPRSLPEQIELAADYWQYALVKARRERDKEARAIRAGDWTRLADDIGIGVFNLGCGIGCLVLGALPLTVLTPLVLAVMHFHLKQQATKAALIDYFLDKPELNRSKLTPPPGV